VDGDRPDQDSLETLLVAGQERVEVPTELGVLPVRDVVRWPPSMAPDPRAFSSSPPSATLRSKIQAWKTSIPWAASSASCA
jgi:hypothetical protein